MPLKINENLAIPDQYLRISYVRSQGPGGQNVNKVNTCAELTFDLANACELSPAVKRRLGALAGRRLTAEGKIIMRSDRHREQSRNRDEVLDRLTRLIRAALVRPKVRKPSKPTRASREKRLQLKREKSDKKRQRRSINLE